MGTEIYLVFYYSSPSALWLENMYPPESEDDNPDSSERASRASGVP